MADLIGDLNTRVRQNLDARERETVETAKRRLEESEKQADSLQRQLDLQRGLATSARESTKADIEAGRAFGRDVLGEEGLGRLGTDPEIQGVLSRFKETSEKGLGTAEALAKREEAFQGIGRATQTAERALLARLGGRGVRGAVAGRQLADVQLRGLEQRAGVERDIFLESEGLKRAGLKDFAEALGQVKTFDLGQAAREKDIEISAGLGFGQLGQAERSAMAQAEAQRQAAAQRAASSCFAGKELILMGNNEYKPISEIKIGDITSQGLVYGCSKHLLPTQGLVIYEGIHVSQDHPVCENGIWMLAGDSSKSRRVVNEMGISFYVYDLWTANQRLEVKGTKGNVLFTDYDGLDNVHELNKQLVKDLNAKEAKHDFTLGGLPKGKVRPAASNLK